MTKPPPTDDPLASELRREAHANEPAFSEALHARTMQAVRAQAQPRVLRWRAFAMGLAAALALVAGLWVWHELSHSSPPPSITRTTDRAPAPALPPLPAFEPGADLEQQLRDARLAYLEHDARRFGRFLLEQVAVAPEIEPTPMP